MSSGTGEVAGLSPSQPARTGRGGEMLLGRCGGEGGRELGSCQGRMEGVGRNTNLSHGGWHRTGKEKEVRPKTGERNKPGRAEWEAEMFLLGNPTSTRAACRCSTCTSPRRAAHIQSPNRPQPTVGGSERGTEYKCLDQKAKAALCAPLPWGRQAGLERGRAEGWSL